MSERKCPPEEPGRFDLRNVDPEARSQPLLSTGEGSKDGADVELPLSLEACHTGLQALTQELRWVLLENQALRDENASLLQTNAALQGENRELVYQDHLTGLPNRRFVDKCLRGQERRSRSPLTNEFAILVVDVNEFKRINDRFGHLEGDRALCWVAQFLVKNTRDTDVCCRLAGDEFLAILSNTTAAGAETVMNRLREKLETENEGRMLPIQLSMGAAAYPAQGMTVEELFDAADAAMYRDKRRQKRVPFSFFALVQHRRSARRLVEPLPWDVNYRADRPEVEAEGCRTSSGSDRRRCPAGNDATT